MIFSMKNIAGKCIATTAPKEISASYIHGRTSSFYLERREIHTKQMI